RRFLVPVQMQSIVVLPMQTCWLRNLLGELHTPLSSATLIYCDNVYLSCNPVQHQRTKHIEIDIHFIRDLVVASQVRVLHVPSRYQFADIFTKDLSSTLFGNFNPVLASAVLSLQLLGSVSRICLCIVFIPIDIDNEDDRSIHNPTILTAKVQIISTLRITQ
ncbi:ribonuclease H-like domain-containing protein, partial [Tanacetum coccineum]